MYESYYGFREKPFSLLPDPAFLYLGKKHRLALTMLEYGLMNRASITVISGEIGSGKTTLIRQLLNQVGEDVSVGLISNTHQSFGSLLQWVALAFGLPHENLDQVALYRQFVEYLVTQYADRRRTVLIVDEAQNLSAETLEELRLLSNVNADKDQVVQLVLVGQPELRDTLKRSDLRQFAQRVGVAYHLAPLEAAETDEYIGHRLIVAGGDPDLFAPAAMRFIHRQAGGVPRLINVICDTALVYGFADAKAKIELETVVDVVRDRLETGFQFSDSEVSPPVLDESVLENGDPIGNIKRSKG